METKLAKGEFINMQVNITAKTLRDGAHMPLGWLLEAWTNSWTHYTKLNYQSAMVSGRRRNQKAQRIKYDRVDVWMYYIRLGNLPFDCVL